MEIHYHDRVAKLTWQEAVKAMDRLRIPWKELLEGTNIWLGKNPRPEIRGRYRGYYSFARKDIVVTEHGFYQNTNFDDTFRMRTSKRTLLHEIGHHIHFMFLPTWTEARREPKQWKDWSIVTGYELEFERGGQHDTVRSYEDFANDFRDWVIRRVGGTERKKFYYGLWGQKYMAEIMLKIGSRDIYLDGEKVGELDIPARIEKGRTVLELRGIGEVLGAEFDWEPKEGKTENVYIYR